MEKTKKFSFKAYKKKYWIACKVETHFSAYLVTRLDNEKTFLIQNESDFYSFGFNCGILKVKNPHYFDGLFSSLSDKSKRDLRINLHEILRKFDFCPSDYEDFFE